MPRPSSVSRVSLSKIICEIDELRERLVRKSHKGRLNDSSKHKQNEISRRSAEKKIMYKSQQKQQPSKVSAGKAYGLKTPKKRANNSIGNNKFSAKMACSRDEDNTYYAKITKSKSPCHTLDAIPTFSAQIFPNHHSPNNRATPLNTSNVSLCQQGRPSQGNLIPTLSMRSHRNSLQVHSHNCCLAPKRSSLAFCYVEHIPYRRSYYLGPSQMSAPNYSGHSNTSHDILVGSFLEQSVDGKSRELGLSRTAVSSSASEQQTKPNGNNELVDFLLMENRLLTKHLLRAATRVCHGRQAKEEPKEYLTEQIIHSLKDKTQSFLNTFSEVNKKTIYTANSQQGRVMRLDRNMAWGHYQGNFGAAKDSIIYIMPKRQTPCQTTNLYDSLLLSFSSDPKLDSGRSKGPKNQGGNYNHSFMEVGTPQRGHKVSCEVLPSPRLRRELCQLAKLSQGEKDPSRKQAIRNKMEDVALRIREKQLR